MTLESGLILDQFDVVSLFLAEDKTEVWNFVTNSYFGKFPPEYNSGEQIPCTAISFMH